MIIIWHMECMYVYDVYIVHTYKYIDTFKDRDRDTYRKMDKDKVKLD